MKTSNGIELSGSSSGTFTYNQWGLPERIEVNEVGETIEMVFKEKSLINTAVYPPRPPQERVFKIVYSCIDGKWNKSEPIYGKIIEAQEENYVF